ncbi:unnamed protein product [Caenorhabditis angaria]|uniref:Potassium channel domain-containing protein n=1 Tax=Caenorhabditis angaria TaxID=860376 RepID=A0A9P1ISN1_9PELO|nr:unnamed protein product [Caenorhabditis angaria]
MTNDHSFHEKHQKHSTVLEEIDEEQDPSVKDEEEVGNERKRGVSLEQQGITVADILEKTKEEDELENKVDEKKTTDQTEDEPETQNSVNSVHRYAKNRENLASGQEAIDRYYERNNYTVTGKDRNSEFYNKLPSHLQHRMNAPNFDSTSRHSKMSSPGANGETVVPSGRRFDKSVYWLAFNRKKIGFRHICMIFLILIYTLLGAAMFYSVESRFEEKKALLHVKDLEKLLSELAANVTENVNNPNTTTTMPEMRDYIREAYIALMKLEGQYKGSTYYKLDDVGNNWKWSFKSAFFFSMNVYTTTGYGSIAPESDLGQFLVVVYGFIFIPITLVTLRDLGQLCLGNKIVDEDEMIQIPVITCFGILTAYLAFCTFFIYFYDQALGPDEGIPLFLSFYFSFVSLSTIGLGDVMPNNATFSPIISIMFFFGMALTKVVNRTTYICVENGIFGGMTMIENKLDSIVNSETSKVDDMEPSTPPKFARAVSVDAGSVCPDGTNPNDLLNTMTVRSLATFMRSNADIYGGGFGRVQLRRGDLMNPDNQATISSISQLRRRSNTVLSNGQKSKEEP